MDIMCADRFVHELTRTAFSAFVSAFQPDDGFEKLLDPVLFDISAPGAALKSSSSRQLGRVSS